MGTRATACGQLEHLRPDRGQDAATLRDAVLVELVEVVVERVDWLAIRLICLAMADADAEQEAVGVVAFDAVKGLRDEPGVRRPDVHDAAGHLQRRGRPKHRFGPIQLARRRSTPQTLSGARPNRYQFQADGS